MTADDLPTSPFFSRAYGGYTTNQMEFAHEVIGRLNGRSILDPMSGQCFALGEWALEGSRITALDINPGPLALALLRDPALIAQAESLQFELRRLVAAVAGCADTGADFIDTWLSPSICAQLSELGARLGLSSPTELRQVFLERDLFRRFAVGAVVLSARRLASFRRTDNLTWLKPGGLLKSMSLSDAILAETSHWLTWARRARAIQIGSGRLRTIWCEAGGAALSRYRASIVVSSPPYANRLDYTRLWAPELAVLEALSEVNIGAVKRSQMGTNLVVARATRTRVPREIERALSAIRRDPTPFSATYYYNFFRNYAEDLAVQCRNIANALPPGGLAIVFVRDTVRKDVLFPTSQLVQSVFEREHGFHRQATNTVVVRSHVGYRRRNQTSGLYGLAQRERWLAFRKPNP